MRDRASRMSKRILISSRLDLRRKLSLAHNETVLIRTQQVASRTWGNVYVVEKKIGLELPNAAAAR